MPIAHRLASTCFLRVGCVSKLSSDAGALAPLIELLSDSTKSAGLSTSTLQSVASTAYLSQLLKYPLDRLSAEPASLATAASQLDGELASLCFRSYPTFLLAHECTTSISTSFSDLDGSLTGLVEAADGLSRACDAFDKHAGPALRRRAKIGEALEHVDRLGDILELPRLVATCVRAGHWAEALDLAQRADELELRARASDLSGSAQLMRRVKDEIGREIVGLRARVLEALRERSLKLPAAMRAVAILRRLGGGEDIEPSLRLIFLASRADCLSSQLDQLQAGSHGDADEDRVRFVKRWVEIWRDVIGDTAAIYADVFGPSGAKAMVSLHAFLQHALSRLMAMLEVHLPHITPVASLSALLTQLSYCAAAFSRHGLDFRPQIAVMISNRVNEIIVAKWQAAHEAFAAELSGRTGRETLDDWLIAPDARARALATDLPPAPALPTQLVNSSLPPALVNAVPVGSSSATPAQSLTLFPPLARLANAHASALNELRLLPAQALYPTLRAAQVQNLINSGDLLLTLADAVGEDVELVRRTIGWYARALLPYFEQALRRGVYGKTDDEDTAVAQLRIRCEEAMAQLEAAYVDEDDVQE